MAFDPITAGLGLAEKLIDRFIPDPALKAKALGDLRAMSHEEVKLVIGSETQLMLAQIQTNQVEAQHGGWFKGGWRPAIGWTCAAAFALKFVIFPILILFVQVIAHFTGAVLFPLEFLPELEWTDLLPIMLGMLGLGTMRTYEKAKTMIENRISQGAG